VTVFEAFDVISTDSLAWVVPTASISMPIGSMRAGCVMTGIAVAVRGAVAPRASGAESLQAVQTRASATTERVATALDLVLDASECLRSLHAMTR
jgi:hypothetical protein